ncbi:fatty acyl-AMP ligase [Dyadobacter arcticus]|uniref:Acyl-CoA synthetase (AMP-forming)/AMP-acid ligase II n=1 Tax=Dyadobacter arcticus TaxID=1078754 RepID=A0ABX0UGL4_9BACT|nr:fatty acyl-AMP ligase [Dyadobacter arcticus]NIJ51224.1 acyl-CoA synthetase (AMP-forming)/AMP-acid ligase II [Dyadobacter arcticus]
MDILEILESNAKLYPYKSAYRYIDKNGEVAEKLNYLDLKEEISAAAGQLAARYEPDSRVIILLPAEAAFIRFFLASLHTGLVAVPCPIGYSESGVNRILNIIGDCRAAGIITNRKTYKMLFQRQNDASRALLKHEIDWFFTDDFAAELPPVQRDRIKPDTSKPAYLQYTSGSTSRPKGVMISHANLVANLSAINHCFGRTAADTSVTWLPHYHDMGLVDGLLSPIYTGGSGIVISPLIFITKPFLLLQAISQYRAGFCGGPGFGLDHCLARIAPEQVLMLDLSSLRVLYVGAEPIRISTLERFAEIMKVTGFKKESLVPAYGLAEATLAVSLHLNGTPLIYQKFTDSGSKEVVACGPPVEYTEVQIVEPVQKITLGNAKIGEIWVKNAGVALGYWQNEEITNDTFRAFTNCGKGPFLRTGDLGFMKNGKLFITGRIKELIIIRGVNYYPQDIEEVVSGCHDAIQPNATAAFSIETEEGEALMIVSEVRRIALLDDNIDSIKSRVAHSIGLAFGLIVHRVVLIDPGKLPKTSSGKIQRLKARQAFAEN